jgi:hypothetical protein
MIPVIRRAILIQVIGLAAVVLAAGGTALAASVAGAPARPRAVHPRHSHRGARRRRGRVLAPRQSLRLKRSENASAALRFGVYPWASPGAIDPVAPPVPDDPNAALAAVKQLQGTRSFVVHLYGQYTGADSGEAEHLLSDARWWSQNGVEVEMVLRYRPAREDLADGFAGWVSSVSTSLAQIPHVVAIQVGNEGNNSSSGAAGDGAYPGAVSAIADGVIAARAAVLAAGRADVKIGFNWAAGSTPCRPDPYFSALRRAGGAAFSSAVGWVGVDIYPATWSGVASDSPSPDSIATTITDALRCLRVQGMPAAGLSQSTSITLAETGYPTDASRSADTQAAVLREIVGAVQRVAASYDVTDLRWFSLRDANTASLQLENGYGLLQDDYSPKPAFQALAQLIQQDGD